MKRRALFVGIDNYQHLTRLNCAVADAASMEEFFSGVGYETERLENPRHTDEVTGRVRALREGLEAGDLLLVFFAGHGVASPERTPWLLCADAHPDSVLLGGDKISFAEWEVAVRGPQDTVVIIDACLEDFIREGSDARKALAEKEGELADKNLEIEKLKRQLAALQAHGVTPRGFFRGLFGRRDFGYAPGKGGQTGVAPSVEKTVADAGRTEKQGLFAVLLSCQKGMFAYEFNGHGLFTQSFLAELRLARDGGLQVQVDSPLWKRVNERMAVLGEKLEARVGQSVKIVQQSQLIPSLEPITLLAGSCDKRDAPPAAPKARNRPEGKEAFSVELAGGALLRMQWCPASTSGDWTNAHGGRDWFEMGSPTDEPCRGWLAQDDRDMAENRHPVCLSGSFWIGETAVTQGQWRAVMGTGVEDLCAKAIDDCTPYEWPGSNPASPQTFRERKRKLLEGGAGPAALCYNEKDEAPVYFASWNDAMEFCVRLTEAERKACRLPAEYVYRLPTEAEWEFACRAGTETTLPNGLPFRPDSQGMDATALDSIAWYAGNSFAGWEAKGEDPAKYGRPQSNPALRMAQRSVHAKDANAWHVKGMLGNVWEWCLDFAGPYPLTRQTDPCGPDGGRHRIVRGGCWYSDAFECRPAARWRHEPGFRNWSVGFRVVLAREMRS